MKHIPRKRFGQNFLVDEAVLSNITAAINPAREDVMVEIGPGLGAMTTRLLEGLLQLHVVELDRDLVTYLKKQFSEDKLVVHAADALTFDFASLLEKDQEGKKIRVVGNLPYNISTPLLFHLCNYVDRVVDQHFMLQKEVVERMVAEPGNKAYGRLSVMLQWRYYMENLFIVLPHAFEPPPKVESAIVRMIPIPLESRLVCDEAKLQAVVSKAFSLRRKVIKNSLAGMFTEAQLEECGIDPSLRPEELSVEEYVSLANFSI